MSAASILIAEDELIIAADLASRLRKLGHHIVDIARRGEDAVALAWRHRPDLVLMDIRLAGETDGIDAARQIWAEIGSPVVFLTAHSDEVTVHRAKHAEAFGYILKPFERRDLVTQIEIALHKHKVEQELRASQRQLRELNAELEARVLERTHRLRALNAELALSEERERQRIARILHDHLSPPLTAACFHMEATLAQGGETERRKNLLTALELIRQATFTSQDLCRDLSPPVAQDFGLVDALRWLGNRMRETHGLQVDLHIESGDPTLPQAAKLLLFNNVRDWLQNLVKLGGSPRVTLRVVPGTGQPLAVEVSCVDGAAFHGHSEERGETAPDLCLLHIRERLHQQGGRLEVEARPQRDGVVRLIAPLDPSPDPLPHPPPGPLVAPADRNGGGDPPH